MDPATFDACMNAARSYLEHRGHTILSEFTDDDKNNFVCRKEDFLTVAVDLRITDADRTVIYDHVIPDEITLPHLVLQALDSPVNPENTSLFDFERCDRLAHDKMDLFLTNSGRVFIEYRAATSLPLPLYVKMTILKMTKDIDCYNFYVQDAFDTGKIDTGWVPVCFDEFVNSEECANMQQ